MKRIIRCDFWCLCLFACVLPASPLFGQDSVVVVLTDCQSGRPVTYGYVLDSLDARWSAGPDDFGQVVLPAAPEGRALHFAGAGYFASLAWSAPGRCCVSLNPDLYPPAEVTAYAQERNWQSTAAPVATVGRNDIRRTDGYSLLPALNAVPGVVMDSRGNGGSHRLSIRGSAFRSPFAVRNIKMYVEGFPFTGPDGQTPLELADAADVADIEIIRGPAGSLYGSTNGGVLHFRMMQPQEETTLPQVSVQAGREGLLRLVAVTSFGYKRGSVRVSVIQADNPGYRAHERNQKEQMLVSVNHRLNRHHRLFGFGLWYAGDWDLPGGLTAAQAEQDPRSANPYAVSHNAHVDRRRMMSGIRHDWVKEGSRFSQHWQTACYGYATRKVNPYGNSAFNQGFKEEDAPGAGLRSQYKLHMTAGQHSAAFIGAAEWQWEDYSISEFVNALGTPGPLKYRYDIVFNTSLAAAAVDYWFLERLNLYAGTSINLHSQQVIGEIPNQAATDTAFAWRGNLLPRLSVGWRVMPAVFVFASLGSGNSTPNVFETIDPVTRSISPGLDPETSRNREAGIKCAWPAASLQAEASVFSQRTSNAITANLDSVPGSDETYTRFINNGRLNQDGLEWRVRKSVRAGHNQQVLNLWAAGTVYAFGLDDFHDEDQDFSGAQMPGIPRSTVNSGVSLTIGGQWDLALNHFWQDKVPLDNSNSAWAPARHLLNASAQFRVENRRGASWQFALFINNLTATHYTSFFQFNAPGGRFFNPAAPLEYAFRVGCVTGAIRR